MASQNETDMDNVKTENANLKEQLKEGRQTLEMEREEFNVKIEEMQNQIGKG